MWLEAGTGLLARQEPRSTPPGIGIPGTSIGNYNVASNDPQRLGLDPTIAAGVAKTPLPNNFSGGDGLNTAYFTWASPAFERQQDNMIRIDHQLSDRHWLFARGSWGYQNYRLRRRKFGHGVLPRRRVQCQHRAQSEKHSRKLALRGRRPNIINEFIFGHSEFTFDFLSPQAQPGQIFFQGGDGGGTVANNLGAGDAPVIMQNLSYAIGNLRTIRTRQFVDNLHLRPMLRTPLRRASISASCSTRTYADRWEAQMPTRP